MSDDERQFLGLTAAAKLLDVHPATLRRWADQGDVLCVTTPGGHRRFLRSEVEALLKHRDAEPDQLTDELVESALLSTRLEIERMESVRWMSAMSDGQRNHLREEGRNVMGLLREFLTEGADRSAIIDRVRDTGTTYANSAKRARLTLTELLEAVSFFRSHILETAVEQTNLSSDERRDVFRRVNTFLNEFLLSVAKTFDASDDPRHAEQV